MIHNTRFIEGIKGNNPHINSYVVIDGVQYLPNDSLISWETDFKASSFIGGFSSCKLTLELAYTGEVLNFANKKIALYVSCNGEVEIMGRFKVLENGQTTDTLNKTIKLTAFDDALKFDVVFDQSVIQYPVTLKEYLKKVVSQVGVEMVETTGVLDSFVLSSAPNFSPKATCRTIVSHYAQCNFFMALINREGKLIFKSPLVFSVGEITPYDFTSIELEKSTVPINCLTLSRAPQEDNVIYPTTVAHPSQFKMVNNGFIDFSRSIVIEQLYNVIQGFSYTPYKMDLFARPELEIGDVVTIKDDRNVGFNAIYLNVKTTFNGGLISTISCPTLPETLTEYKLAGIKDTIYNTEILVDKVKQQIQSIVDVRIPKLEGQINTTQTQITQTNTSIQQEVIARQQMGELLTQEISSRVKQTSDGFQIELERMANGQTLTQNEVERIKSYFHITDEGALLGKSNDPVVTRYSNRGMEVVEGGKVLAYFKDGTMFVKDIIVELQILLGYHVIKKYDSPVIGNSTIMLMGGEH